MMGLFRSKRIEIRLVAFVLTFLMVGQGTIALAGSGRIYPQQKVTLYRGEDVVGIFTKEAPLPQGTVMVADGRCAIRLDDWYLVAEDKSVFSIDTSGAQRNLFVEKGTVYFKTAGMNGSFAFITPQGQIDIQRILVKAAHGDQTIKGYLSATKEQGELGVAEGGAMEVITDEGVMTVQSGNKIILAQADMDIGLPEEEPTASKEPAETEKKGWSKTTRNIAIGALGVAAAAGIAIGLSGGGGDDGGGNVSPSSP